MVDVLLACLGWAFHMLCVTLLTWDTGLTFFTGNVVSIATFAQLILLLGYCTGFAVCAISGTLFQKRMSDVFLLSLSAALLALGAAFTSLTDFSQGLVALAGFALLGGSCSVSFALWQRIFSRFPSNKAGAFIAVGSVVSTMLITGIFLTSLTELTVAIAVCSGAISLALAVACSRGRKPLSMDCASTVSVKSVLVRNWRSMLCVAFFGFVWELMTSLVAGDSRFSSQMSIVTSAANAVAAIVLAAILLHARKSPNLVIVYQVIFPVVSTGFILMPFLGTGYQALFSAITCGLFAAVSILMQVTCIQDFERNGEDPAVVIGVFAFTVYLSMTVGFFVGRWILPLGSMDFSMLLVISLMLVYGLALVNHIVRARKNTADENELNDEAHDESSIKESENSVESRCLVIAERFGLTHRETEVLILMAKGRNLPFISDGLVVSKNTIRSHYKNIYRKLGVHSKQELLDLVESC